MYDYAVMVFASLVLLINVTVLVVSAVVVRRRDRGRPTPSRPRGRSIAYWALVTVLIVFGFLGIASIGIPFLFIGLALATLAPYRGRADIFWPPVLAMASFFIGYIMIAPLWCHMEESDEVLEISQTACTNFIGLTYSGSGNYNPSLVPGLLYGLVLAGAIGLISTLALRRRHEHHRLCD